jgi:hypothetical protein
MVVMEWTCLLWPDLIVHYYGLLQIQYGLSLIALAFHSQTFQTYALCSVKGSRASAVRDGANQ